MAQVKILKSIASHNFSFSPGQITTLDDDIARKWQINGICEPHEPEPVDVDETTEDQPKTVKKTRK
jgi:hypothetical protein